MTEERQATRPTIALCALVLLLAAGPGCHRSLAAKDGGALPTDDGDGNAPAADMAPQRADTAPARVDGSRPDAPADGSTADLPPPVCPADPPVAAKYPFTPIACTQRDQAAHLSCPYDITSGRAQGCHVALECICVSSQMLNVPPDCYWIPGATGYQCPADGGAESGGQDAGAIACGSHTCAPDQYCVSKGGGPLPRCVPHTDGGACPSHTTEGCSYPIGPGCQEMPDGSVECAAVPSSCAAQEPCRCLCFLAPGPAGGCSVNGQRVSCNYP